jgi:general secretion pathway protein A
MYTKHFRLDEPPFSIAPNPRYLYLSPQHREALAHLLYGIGVGGGFVALTGEVGTGKTTLCRCLLEQLPEDVDIALIFNPRLNSRELVAGICDELHIAYPAKASLKQLIDVLNHRLLEAHARGRRTIVLIDEAQNLRFDVLEQIRLLTNLETNRAKLLQIILVGQPELNEVLERPHLRQLAQRVTARYHLEPLSCRETGDYIHHRLAVSGGREPLFTGAAIRLVHARSGGIPRLINLICDRALLGAYTLGRHRVNRWVARNAARELLPGTRWSPAPVLAAGLAGMLVLAGGLLFLDLVPESLRPTQREPAVAEAKPARNAPPAPAEPVAGTPGPAAVPKETAATPAPATVPASPVPEAPVPADKQPELPPVSPVPFAQWIADPARSRAAAFVPLFASWKLEYPAASPDPCGPAGRQGLRCLALHGSWFQLRSFNHPAVLEFLLPNGARRYAALVKLHEGRIELAAGPGGVAAAFELAEVLPLWKGDSVILWKPPAGDDGPLLEGRRSGTVAWLRDRLRSPAPAGREDIFDADLKARVMAFQAERGLVPDGVVGAQTLIYLGMKDGDSSIPRLEPVLH